MNLQLHDLRRVLRQYSSSIYHGAEGRFDRLVPIAYRAARARFKYGIGPIPFSVLQLSAIPEGRWLEYVLDNNEFKRDLQRMSPPEMHRLAYNKVLFFEHCLRQGLPAITIICRVGGSPDPLGTVVPHVNSVEQFGAILQAAPERLFIKPIDGAHAEGAFLALHADGRCEFLPREREQTLEGLYHYLHDQQNDHSGFIVQRQERPHERMKPFASANALPSVRVVTVSAKDGPRILFACLKIPVGTSISDNFSDGAGGNLLAGVDIETGVLTAARGSLRKDWPVMVTRETHPDTGHLITGSRLPLWDSIAELALRAQASVPRFKSVGWDIAPTESGVVLIEANSGYDMSVLQVAHQRGLKAELLAGLAL